MSYQHNKCYYELETFPHAGLMYRHLLFTEDERVELKDNFENTHLVFDKECVVTDNKGKIVGVFHIVKNWAWEFVVEGSPNAILFGPDLIKAEVEISKMYLRGEFK